MVQWHPFYKKLAEISKLSAVFLGSIPAVGQVLYQDFDPDLVADGEDWYPNNFVELDLNLDGEIDATVIANVWDPCSYCGADSIISIDVADNITVPAFLSESHICTDCDWGTYLAEAQYLVNIVGSSNEIPGSLNFDINPSKIISYNQGNYSSCWSDGCQFGPSLYGGYIPLNLNIDGLDYYGWIRLSISFGSAIIKETAFSLVPETTLETGVLPDSIILSPATNLSTQKISHEGLPSDIQLQALPSAGETYIERYRLFVLPEELSGELTAETLSTYPEEHSIIWTPNDDTIQTIIPSDQLAYDGSSLEVDSNYVFVILHEIEDSPFAFLSEYSASFFFNSMVAEPSITSFEVNCDSIFPPQLIVSWNAPEDTLNISSYRLYLGKDPSPGGAPPPLPEASELILLSEDQYIEVEATEAMEYEAIIPNDLFDISGNPISNDTTYVLFVLSVPEFEYQLPAYDYSLNVKVGFIADPVKSLIASDLGDSGSISDIHVSFDHGEDESHTYSYRIFLNQSGHPEPDTAFILDAPVGTYTYSPLLGSSESVYLSPYSSTWDGETVLDSTLYYVIVASIPNSIPCTYTGIEISGTFLYLNPSPPASIVSIEDISDYGTPADLRVNFLHAEDESKILEYRILLSDSYLFDLDFLESLLPNQYLSVPTSETIDTSAVTLKHFQKDYQNEVIEPEKTYHVYVISYAKPGFESNISEPFSFVSFNPSLASNLQLIDQNIFDSANDLLVKFNPLDFESPISEYRIYILPTNDTVSISGDYLTGLPSEYYLSASTGLDDVIVQCTETLLALDGLPISLSKEYVAAVVAYNEEQPHQFVSQFSNSVVLEEGTEIPSQASLGGTIEYLNDYVKLTNVIALYGDKIILRDNLGRDTGLPVTIESDYYLINISSLPAGMYFLELSRNDRNHVWKVLVNK